MGSPENTGTSVYSNFVFAIPEKDIDRIKWTLVVKRATSTVPFENGVSTLQNWFALHRKLQKPRRTCKVPLCHFVIFIVHFKWTRFEACTKNLRFCALFSVYVTTLWLWGLIQLHCHTGLLRRQLLPIWVEIATFVCVALDLVLPIDFDNDISVFLLLFFCFNVFSSSPFFVSLTIPHAQAAFFLFQSFCFDL